MFVDDDEMRLLTEKLDQLLDLESGLSPKDLEFVCGLDEDWEGNFTERQAGYLESIWAHMFERGR